MRTLAGAVAQLRAQLKLAAQWQHRDGGWHGGFSIRREAIPRFVRVGVEMHPKPKCLLDVRHGPRHGQERAVGICSSNDQPVRPGEAGHNLIVLRGRAEARRERIRAQIPL